MTAAGEAVDRHRFSPAQYFICLKGIVWREALRFIHQRERFVSALVRPLVWLFIFAAGFRQVLGVSIIPPYETYVLYEVYIAPGLIAMIQLFNGMQSSLTMVYDRETGGMRTLLVSPFPRWWLLTSKQVLVHYNPATSTNELYELGKAVPGTEKTIPYNINRMIFLKDSILLFSDNGVWIKKGANNFSPLTLMPPFSIG